MYPKISALVLLIVLSSCGVSMHTVRIPDGNSMLLIGGKDGQNGLINPYPNAPEVIATIKNKSAYQVGVRVMDKANKNQVKGFGLNKFASAKLTIEKNQRLLIDANRAAKVKVTFSLPTPVPAKRQLQTSKTISFFLINPTNQPIPLRIPGVMNPNLSPNSESRVNLTIGQEIFLNKLGRRKRVLVVTDDIKNGQKIDVSRLY